MANLRTGFQRPQVLSENLFPVVGVGASAGGLDAFKNLIRAIPLHSGFAYILIQHLAPHHESLLPEILQKVTEIPVIEIIDKVLVLPNHIYIIPSNKILTANDGMLLLDERVEGERVDTVDVFFTSLAEIHQEHAIGVVLSGTGNDGTVGLKNIKDQGGITIVQDKESARFYGMPQSAINADVVDFILSPDQIPSKLLELVTSARILPADNKASEEIKEDEVFRNILALLRSKRGVDFTYYKQTTIRRRVLRRKALLKIEKLKDYQHFLVENKAEQDALFKDILIPVTSFFRDEQVFILLCEKIFPSMFKENGQDEPLRIWIAGCSTGEEVYSMAICIQEYISEHPTARKVQIFATDISDISISKARSGIYQKKDLAGISEERLRTFFNRIDGSYQVSKAVREMCVFATHNFLKDPPFAKMQLVSCRNVLIYMETYLQKKALSAFYYSLMSDGFLLLGKSESPGQSNDQFESVNHQYKLYLRKPSQKRFVQASTYFKETPVQISNTVQTKELRKDDYHKAADDALLSKYEAVGVIVNNEMNILQFRGATGLYLEAPPGAASHNILKMAKEGMSFELRAAFQNVKASGEHYIKEGIVLDKARVIADIEVIPLKHTIEQYYLVLFKSTASQPLKILKKSSKGKTASQILIPDPTNSLVQRLQLELAQVREDTRTIIEDQETANEELQSANEELLSGSEELQSLNEELETTKEEIQSSNEELTILNQELQERNEQFISARQYAEAVVTTIHEPLIVLTKNFMVRTVNKAYIEKFNTSGLLTEGKQFFELHNNMWDVAGLREKLEKVLPEHSYVGDIELTINEMVFIINARQLINEYSNEQLILVAINDITERKSLEHHQETFAQKLEMQVIERTRQLEEANVQLNSLNENLLQFASIASHDLQEPLRKIKTFVSILNRTANDNLSEHSKGIMLKIGNATDKMSQLIAGVLQYSRITHSTIDFQPTDLDEILNQVIGDLDLMIKEKSAIVLYKEKLPVIDGMPLQLTRLLYNLIVNSIKFQRPGVPAQVTIVHRLFKNEAVEDFIIKPGVEYLEIKISDNGIGFEAQFATQIFQIFERLHNSAEYEGTGIGLAICKKIVEHHHGHIAALPIEPGGAVFVIILPLTQSGL